MSIPRATFDPSDIPTFIISHSTSVTQAKNNKFLELSKSGKQETIGESAVKFASPPRLKSYSKNGSSFEY